MADNVTLDPGPNPSITYKSDDVGSGVQVPYLKIDKGADGASSPVTDANPLPISAAALPLPADAATETTLALRASETTLSSILTELQAKTEPANTQTIAGTVTANLGTIAGVATEVTLGSILTELQQKTEPADTQPISAASLPLPAGAATEAKQTQPGVDIGDVTINNAGGASAVNIQDGGNSITVDGTVTANPPATNIPATQTITANGQRRFIALGENKLVSLNIGGTYGSIAIAFEISFDGGATYPNSIQMVRSDSNTVEIASGTISNTARTWKANCGAATHFSVRSTAWTSGTMNVVMGAVASSAEPVPAIASHAVTLSSTTLTAVTPGTGATNLGKATDAVAGATDTGVAALQRRRNTPISGGGVSADGDYMPLQGNLYGGQWVSYVDGSGNVLECPKAALAYNAAGLGVRRPADAYIMSSQEGTLVAPHGYFLYATRTTTVGSTTAVIEVTVDPSTVTRRGDKIKIASGTHAEGIYQEGVVSSVSSTSITLQFPISVAPPTSRAIYIYKPLAFICDSAGQQYVNANMTASVGVYPVYANKFFCDKGELAFGSISGAYATIATTVQQIAVIKVVNGTNVPLMFSFDAGSTDWTMVPAGQSDTLPAIQNGGYVDATTDIMVKDIGSAAASGSAYYFGYYF